MIGKIGLSYFYHLYNKRYQRFLIEKNVQAVIKLDNSLQINNQSMYYINQPGTVIITKIDKQNGNLNINDEQVSEIKEKVVNKEQLLSFFSYWFIRAEEKQITIKTIPSNTINIYDLLYNCINDNSCIKKNYAIPIHHLGLSLSLEHKLSIETKYQKNTFSHRNDVNVIFLLNLYLYQSIYHHLINLKQAYLSVFLGSKYIHFGLGHCFDNSSINLKKIYVALLIKLWFFYIIIKFFVINNSLEFELIINKVFINPIKYINHNNPYKKLYKLI